MDRSYRQTAKKKLKLKRTFKADYNDILIYFKVMHNKRPISTHPHLKLTWNDQNGILYIV